MIKRLAVALFSFIVVLVPARLIAQQEGVATATVTTAAPIFVVPEANRVPLRTAAVNTTLKVLDEREDWLQVEFQDPQFGRRVGWIQTKFVRVNRPELQPMDLSIKPEPRKPVEGKPIAEPPTPPPTRPTVHREPSPQFARGWVDVNFGMATAGDKDYTSVYSFTRFRETATYQVEYHLPTGASFDFGGGFMFTPNIGVGASFAGTAHEDVANLRIRIPHPTISNTFAEDTAPTDSKLMRTEGAAHIQVMFAQDVTPRLRVRAFTGPSFFRVQRDAVSDIVYDQAFLVFSPVNAVVITNFERVEVPFDEATGWGFHVGGDVSWFFSRVVGIGGIARFSRGTIKAFDPLPEESVDLKVGGFQAAGGLRLRF
jgi:hypothetical protein